MWVPLLIAFNMFLLLNLFYWFLERLTHSGQAHCPTGTSKSDGVRHSKCYPVNQILQITIIAARLALPHNWHLKPVGIWDVLGCIISSICGKWHGTQFQVWSFHNLPSHPSNSNTPEPRTSRTRRIIGPIVTSKVVGVVCCK